MTEKPKQCILVQTRRYCSWLTIQIPAKITIAPNTLFHNIFSLKNNTDQSITQNITTPLCEYATTIGKTLMIFCQKNAYIPMEMSKRRYSPQNDQPLTGVPDMNFDKNEIAEKNR